MPQRDRFEGSLIGLAVGDALGTTVEFSGPGSFEPVTDMVGGGVFGLKAGSGPTIRPWLYVWRKVWCVSRTSILRIRCADTRTGIRWGI